VQELLQRALTPSWSSGSGSLQEALARLDPEATKTSAATPAEAQQELRRELERSQELFKRAALEGELASLAKDAEDLQRRQTEWTKDEAQHPDSAAAAAERDLAAATDSLARGVEARRRDRAAEEFAETPRAAPSAPCRKPRTPRASAIRVARGRRDRKPPTRWRSSRTSCAAARFAGVRLEAGDAGRVESGARGNGGARPAPAGSRRRAARG